MSDIFPSPKKKWKFLLFCILIRCTVGNQQLLIISWAYRYIVYGWVSQRYFLKEVWHLKVRPVVIGGENRETAILCVCERTCLGCTALSWLLFLKMYHLQFYSFCGWQWSTNSIFIYFEQYLLQFLKDCFLIDSIKQPKDIILLPFTRLDV